MIAYFGHPKSGSTWVGGLMAGLCRAMGIKYFYGQLSLPKNEPKQILKQGYQAIISQNTTYDKACELGSFKAFHLIRDPRDMIVSGYYSYLKTHPLDESNYFQNIRKKLKSVNLNEGLFIVMDHQRMSIEAMREWNYNTPNILELKFENVIKNPQQEMLKAVSHLGIVSENISNNKFNLIAAYNKACLRLNFSDSLLIHQEFIPTDYLNYLLKKVSFSKLSKNRLPGQENTNSHYRKGTTGDWKALFREEHKTYFKNHFGNILIQLGYENDNDW